ncbi:MAG: polysaccharide biosynthesis tyrosine autokinase [Deltaproteobacteria bacterium]|nr:polysaccharide biosynthesis tyrosine autokinase [Deltaproteobacteria bacterium]
MYNEFYRLNKLPFSISPDPNFVYMSSSHREAMAQLMYGVQERKPLMVVTGEVGVGKTTMIFTLLSHVEKDAQISIIFDTHVDSTSLYRYIFADYKIKHRPADRAEATLMLREYLTERLKGGHRTILILDEAHNLSKEILHEVVFLTNMETMQNKLLQIVLVGQPELNTVLGTHEFRQLRQRISMRTEIRPLDFDNSKAYILHRLTEAGRPDPETLFSEDAVALIYRYSKGIPRLMNTLCDNALLLGYARKKAMIEPEIIKETFADMEIPQVDAAPPPEPAPARDAEPPTPEMDSEGNKILSEETVSETEGEGEQIRIVKRVIRLADGREVVKRVRQIRRARTRSSDSLPRKRRRRRAPLIPLPDGIPTARLTPSADEDLLPAFKHDHAAAVRQFHLLWNKIDTVSEQTPIGSLIVTSSLPREGKSVVSINLAATIAQTPDIRVVLVDADLHQPRTHEYLGLERPERGLADILEGRAELKDCLINYELDRLYYLPAGGMTDTMPTELLVGRTMEKLLDELKGLFHIAVIDSPPIVPIADTVGLASEVDGTVLVIRSRETSRKVAAQAMDDLADKRILGVVLNDLDFRLAGGRYRYKYGYYGYGYGGQGARRRSAAAAE